MNLPRILFAAGSSGSGKTLITCGILQALVNRGLEVASFKCGPDYIDPMFHSKVIGTGSANLDTFFTSKERTKYILSQNAAKSDIAVMEGVMGYYDGVAGTTTRASAYDLADKTDTPVVLIVDSRGMSLSLVAYIKGFTEFKSNSHIRGVIFNRMSHMLYPRMKEAVEKELDIKVLGYVPIVTDCLIESRHLGLVLPEEIPELKLRLQKLSEVLEETVDIDGLIELAEQADELHVIDSLESDDEDFLYHTPKEVRIGVADDEAFCFFYKDNFSLLEHMGATLVHFSPVHDKALPENLDGLLLYGGYPEIYAKALEENVCMRNEIADAIRDGMPCMAECGGFMYLHDEMEDMNGNLYKMVGAIEGKTYYTGKLRRFGYITLTGNDALGEIPAHEFHYFDSTNCGSSLHASKPESDRNWDCIHRSGRLQAGFPHMYYYGNPKVAKAFLENCTEYKNEK